MLAFPSSSKRLWWIQLSCERTVLFPPVSLFYVFQIFYCGTYNKTLSHLNGHIGYRYFDCTCAFSKGKNPHIGQCGLLHMKQHFTSHVQMLMWFLKHLKHKFQIGCFFVRYCLISQPLIWKLRFTILLLNVLLDLQLRRDLTLLGHLKWMLLETVAFKGKMRQKSLFFSLWQDN